MPVHLPSLALMELLVSEEEEAALLPLVALALGQQELMELVLASEVAPVLEIVLGLQETLAVEGCRIVAYIRLRNRRCRRHQDTRF